MNDLHVEYHLLSYDNSSSRVSVATSWWYLPSAKSTREIATSTTKKWYVVMMMAGQYSMCSKEELGKTIPIYEGG